MIRMAFTKASWEYIMGIGLEIGATLHMPFTYHMTARLDGYDNHPILDINFPNGLNVFSTHEYCWAQFQNKYPLEYLVKP